MFSNSGQKKDLDDFPFFPISAQSFMEDRKSFKKDEEKLQLSDGSKDHAATVLQHSRDNSRWVKVKNNYVQPNKKPYINAIIIAAGESLRLFGSMYPRYRIVKESDKPDEQFPICEEISGFKDYFDVLNEKKDTKTPPKDEDVLEGMGRGVTLNAIWSESDFHFGNGCRNSVNYFIIFDHDHKFGFVTESLMTDYNKIPKLVKYDISTYPQIEAKQKHKLVKKDGYLYGYLIKNLPTSHMGTLTTQDYASLPEIQGFLPCAWQFKDVPALSKFVRDHARFVGEKHFTNAYLFVSLKMHFFIWDKVVFHEMHCAMMKQHVEKQFDATLKDGSFNGYLKQYRNRLLNIFYFEVDDWLQHNEDYRYKTESDAIKQRNKILNELIERFNQLLNLCALSPFLPEEVRNFMQFAQCMDFQMVGLFYEEQLQPYRASLVKERMLSSHSQIQKLMPPSDTKDQKAEKQPAPADVKAEKPASMDLPKSEDNGKRGKKRHHEDEGELVQQNQQGQEAPKRRKLARG